MREYSEPTPVDVQSFSTGRILKESWEICRKYFGALVMPMTLIILACAPFLFIIPGKAGEVVNNILLAIFCPIPLMGLHHSVLRLKSEGREPTFAQTFSFGIEYWGRGIRIGMILTLFTCLLVIGAMLVAAIPFYPGAMLVDEHKALGATLIGLGGIVFLGALAWFAARTCLAYSATADGLTSATRAFEFAWGMTKTNIRKTLSLGFSLLGLLVIIAFVFIMAAMIVAGLLNGDQETVNAVLIILGVPTYLFGLAYTHVGLCLTYQALKPEPKEESPAA